MSDKNMVALALAEVRNNYSLKKYGNLNSEQVSLLKYDELCVNLIKENQELKKQLENEYNEGYEKGILDTVEEVQRLDEENQKLNKQLEEYKATNKILSHELTKDKVLQQDCLTTCCGISIGDIPKLIIQQKEFISYLENEIYSIEPKGTGINYNCEYDSEEDYINAMEEQSKLNILKEILSKYKEIIGE